MSSVLSIAVSGMAAAQRRLEVSASNVANVSTTGPLDGADDVRAAYAALRADQTETAGGGTAVKASRASPATIAVSDPGSPFANADGLVAAPNVDFATEAVEQLVARYSFVANAAVIRAEDKMVNCCSTSRRERRADVLHERPRHCGNTFANCPAAAASRRATSGCRPRDR